MTGTAPAASGQQPGPAGTAATLAALPLAGVPSSTLLLLACSAAGDGEVA